MTVTRQPAALGSAAGRERTGDGRGAGDPQDRRWQMRFHVDLQGPAGVAGHHQFDDAVGAASLARAVLRQPQQARLAIGDRPERFAHDDRLGAAAADPAFDRAVRMDDARRAGTGRGRPSDRDHGGDRERPPRRLELGCPDEE